MVFVWGRLTGGDPLFTLSQVALNDAIMVVAFAPLVGLLSGISSITVPWGTLLTSVVLYIVIPVVIAQAWRKLLLKRGASAFDAAMQRIGPGRSVLCSQPWSCCLRFRVRRFCVSRESLRVGGTDFDPSAVQFSARLWPE